MTTKCANCQTENRVDSVYKECASCLEFHFLELQGAREQCLASVWKALGFGQYEMAAAFTQEAKLISSEINQLPCIP